MVTAHALHGAIGEYEAGMAFAETQGGEGRAPSTIDVTFGPIADAVRARRLLAAVASAVATLAVFIAATAISSAAARAISTATVDVRFPLISQAIDTGYTDIAFTAI